MDASLRLLRIIQLTDGLVRRMLGGTLLQALPFYAAAAALMQMLGTHRPE